MESAALVTPADDRLGRDEATRLLWNDHYARLAGWCAAMVTDREVAHEIAAEAFTRLLARWRAVRDPRGFLYITALNLVRDHWRRTARKQRALQRINDAPATRPSTEDHGLHDVVHRLPPRLRDPILLHYFADLPVDVVARALGRPVGSVKRSLSEGRARLRTMLEDADA